MILDTPHYRCRVASSICQSLPRRSRILLCPSHHSNHPNVVAHSPVRQGFMHDIRDTWKTEGRKNAMWNSPPTYWKMQVQNIKTSLKWHLSQCSVKKTSTNPSVRSPPLQVYVNIVWFQWTSAPLALIGPCIIEYFKMGMTDAQMVNELRTKVIDLNVHGIGCVIQ